MSQHSVESKILVNDLNKFNPMLDNAKDNRLTVNNGIMSA